MGMDPTRNEPYEGYLAHLAGRDPVNARLRVVLGMTDPGISDETIISMFEAVVTNAQNYGHLLRGIHRLTDPRTRQDGPAYTTGALAVLDLLKATTPKLPDQP